MPQPLRSPSERTTLNKWPSPGQPPGDRPLWVLHRAHYPFRGIAFLARRREAWRYAVIPGVVNFVILMAAFITSFFFVDDLAALLRPEILDAKASGLLAGAGRGLGNALLYLLADKAEAIRGEEGIPLVMPVVEDLRDIASQTGIAFD